MTDQKSLQDFLKNNGLDAMLLSSVGNISWMTSYFGFSHIERDAFALVTKKNKYVFTHTLYSNEVKDQVKNCIVIEYTAQKPFATSLAEIVGKEKIVNIGFENNDITVEEYLKLTTAITSHFIAKDFSGIRIQKSKSEIDNIKRACLIGDKAYQHLKKFLMPGITELGLAWEIEKFVRESGGELSFPTIVAFGKNSAIPHHHTGDQTLMSNDIILLDFGVKIDGYCSDISRTIFIGKPTKEQEKVYEIVKQAQQEAINYLHNELGGKNNDSVKASDVDTIARDFIIKKGYPSIPHSLGHGIGLDVHEAPRISPNSHNFLAEGMVFSIEPGIYIANKFGVRIEDLYAIRGHKLIQLTNAS